MGGWGEGVGWAGVRGGVGSGAEGNVDEKAEDCGAVGGVGWGGVGGWAG